jgi:hypothetical protein
VSQHVPCVSIVPATGPRRSAVDHCHAAEVMPGGGLLPRRICRTFWATEVMISLSVGTILARLSAERAGRAADHSLWREQRGRAHLAIEHSKEHATSFIVGGNAAEHFFAGVTGRRVRPS